LVGPFAFTGVAATSTLVAWYIMPGDRQSGGLVIGEIGGHNSHSSCRPIQIACGEHYGREATHSLAGSFAFFGAAAIDFGMD
jgi:hypothetical protein